MPSEPPVGAGDGGPLPDGLREARRAWLAAANATDPWAYAACLAEEAVWLPPGMAAIEGGEAIQAWLAKVMQGLSYELTLSEVDVRMAGAWASETGRFHTVMTDESSGGTSEHQGAYLILWREVAAGTWRIDRYVDLTASV